MSNYDHHYHHHQPHVHIVRKPANQPRSDAIMTMQEAIDSTHIMQQSTLSAESSTGSPAGAAAHNTIIAEALKSAILNSSRNPSYLINRSATLNLKLKKSISPKDIIIDDSPRNNYLCSSNYSHVISTAVTIPVISSKTGRINEDQLINISEAKVSACEKEEDQQVAVVCSMCGDVGIAELLFLCSKCTHRHQHIYCSRSYPNISEAEASICNWCLHVEDVSRAAKASSAITNKAERESTSSMEVLDRRPVITQLVHGDVPCQLGDHVMKEVEGDDVIVKKGHSKAFEYLLLVAAQSLPHDKVEISIANPEITHDDRATISAITSKRDSLAVGKAISTSNTDMSKVNTTPLVNIVNMGPAMEAGKTNSTLINNRLNVGLNTNENTRIHSQLKISIGHKSDMDVGRFIGGGIPKRQRCTKGINASTSKCRKKGLQLSPSRPNYRRYKLLADVVC